MLGGKASPSAADVKAILSSGAQRSGLEPSAAPLATKPTNPIFLLCRAAVGAEADDAKISKLLAELSGKDIAEVIKAGSEKLASVPSGGGGGGGAAAAPAAGGAAAPAAAKKEEVKEEEEVVRAHAAQRRSTWAGLRVRAGCARALLHSLSRRPASLRRTWASRCSTKRALACRFAVACARGIKKSLSQTARSCALACCPCGYAEPKSASQRSWRSMSAGSTEGEMRASAASKSSAVTGSATSSRRIALISAAVLPAIMRRIPFMPA